MRHSPSAVPRHQFPTYTAKVAAAETPVRLARSSACAISTGTLPTRRHPDPDAADVHGTSVCDAHQHLVGQKNLYQLARFGSTEISFRRKRLGDRSVYPPIPRPDQPLRTGIHLLDVQFRHCLLTQPPLSRLSHIAHLVVAHHSQRISEKVDLHRPASTGKDTRG
ncbi:hypothetical protein [Streptomyces sp. NPDC013181]|uniref:hypothetical protein n=1 Tax=Streptomyces sp. NPDC013181 TaxID=3364864 RepID=UPI0036B31148